LKNLKELSLFNRKALQSTSTSLPAPERFGDLKSLEKLNLAYCTALASLPKGFGELKILVHRTQMRIGLILLDVDMNSLYLALPRPYSSLPICPP